MLNVSAEVLDTLKAYTLKESKNWANGVCAGKCVNLDGRMHTEGHQYCHSWVSTAFYRQKNEFLTISIHSKTRVKGLVSNEAMDFLIRWMARESPFADWVVNKDDDEWLTEGGIVLLCGGNTGLTANQALWVCKVLRFSTEGEKAAETFMTLVKGGVDPMLAVLVASHVRSLKGATFGYTGQNGHSSVFGGYADVKVTPEGLLARNLTDSPSSTCEVFSPPKGIKTTEVATKIKGFCKPFKKSDGWGGFVTGEGADSESLINHVKAWEEELRKNLEPKPLVERVVAAAKKKLPTKNTVYLDLDM